MNVKERLVELIEQSGACFDCFPVAGYEKDEIEKIASYLIVHGVTVQEWIPVTEQLPEDNVLVVCLIGDTDCPEYDILRWDNDDYRWDNRK